MQRRALASAAGTSCLARRAMVFPGYAASLLPASSRLGVGVMTTQFEQRRTLWRTDKLPRIPLEPQPLPELGPWLQVSLVSSPSDEENPEVRKLLRQLGLSSRNPVTFHRDIPQVRGMLNKVHHMIRLEPVDVSRFDALRADPPVKEVVAAEAEVMVEEEEWVRFKREYIANVQAAQKKKEEAEKRAALAAAKAAADKSKKKKK